MNAYVHLANLLEMIAQERIGGRFRYNAGSPYDKQIHAARRALIEYHKGKVVTDADTEQEDRPL